MKEISLRELETLSLSSAPCVMLEKQAVSLQDCNKNRVSTRLRDGWIPVLTCLVVDRVYAWNNRDFLRYIKKFCEKPRNLCHRSTTTNMSGKALIIGVETSSKKRELVFRK